MTEQELKNITKIFALRIMKLVNSLPKSQLVRSGTSVAANYRAACRGRSKAEFIAKLGTVEEEADESCLWLELIIEGNLMGEPLVSPLLKEANELTAIFVASRISAKRNKEIANRQSEIAN